MRERVYSFSFENVAVTAAQDFFQIEAQTVPAKLLAVYVSQYTDVGDTEAEGLRILIRRVTDAVTNDVAEVKMDGGDGAALANLAINETTQLSTGAENVHAETWNIVQGPFIYLPPPEMRPIIQVGNAIVVALMAAPGDSITCSGTCYFSEVGN